MSDGGFGYLNNQLTNVTKGILWDMSSVFIYLSWKNEKNRYFFNWSRIYYETNI